MSDTPDHELAGLIWRVVTGDGAQLENLDMDREDFARLVDDAAHLGDTGHIPLTADIDDVLAMVDVAKRFQRGEFDE